MIINEAYLFLIFFSSIIIIGFIIVNMFKISGLKKFQLILTYLGSLSALLITYNIYLTIKSNNRIEKHRKAYDTLQNIERSFFDHQKELIDHYPESFFLYASMNPDVDLSAFTPKEYVASKRKMLEMYASQKALQTIEDFITTADFDLNGAYVWINLFLMWFQSPILQDEWKITKHLFAQDSTKAITLIIEGANKLIELRKHNGALSADDYNTLSKKIVPQIEFR